MASHINLDVPFIHKVTILCEINKSGLDFLGNRMNSRHIIAKGNSIEGIKAIE